MTEYYYVGTDLCGKCKLLGDYEIPYNILHLFIVLYLTVPDNTYLTLPGSNEGGNGQNMLCDVWPFLSDSYGNVFE